MQNKKMNRRETIKAYNIAVLDDNSAEINMYGEVYMEAPRDYWTGERIAGSYIAADEFLEDLDTIKDKENITIHINSIGGDLYAGLAIYNRLKMLNSTVTTVNDALAASAGSLIFQAGNIRKMNAGSNLMAHGVSGFLFGFYNTEDLKMIMNQFKAQNKAVVNVYAEAMGVSYAEAESLVRGETWLTGEEAVNKGLADEVIEPEKEDSDNHLIDRFLNKVKYMPVFGINQTAIAAAVPPIANINTIKGGNEEMDIKNVAELKAAYPEFVREIEDAARIQAFADGAEKERGRIREIEAIEDSIADNSMIEEAKYGDNPLSAQELAFKAMQKQVKIGGSVLKDMEKDDEESNTEDVGSDPNGGNGETEEDDEKSKNRIAHIVNIVKGGRK